MPHEHVLMQTAKEFAITSYTTEMLCYMGQQKVFEEAAETIGKLTGTEINAKQIERVCHYYGEQIELQQQRQMLDPTASPTQYDANQPHYVMMDGGMVLTREAGWKEMKLGRIFSAKEPVEVSKNRTYIAHSSYIGHLGSHQDFLEKVEYHTEALRHKIIIADGAKWIWNWAEDFYPDSIQILDFYHAKQHLCEFAQHHFRDSLQKQNWIEAQSTRLLNDQIEQVIGDLKMIKPTATKVRKIKTALINYYQHNSKRMKYKTFKEKGCLIGSGAIEAAHRHVIQQRMKLSGQRWTLKGAQQVANLRMAYKSNQWNQVHQLINNAA